MNVKAAIKVVFVHMTGPYHVRSGCEICGDVDVMKMVRDRRREQKKQQDADWRKVLKKYPDLGLTGVEGGLKA